MQATHVIEGEIERFEVEIPAHRATVCRTSCQIDHDLFEGGG
jgi:hypothetical protein